VDRRLHEIYRVETNIGMIVIAYSERRKMLGNHLEGLERGRGMLSIKQLGLSRRSPRNKTQP
jgi:hypothetical protein